jgi:uncharacterized protein YndB with AHSA1/START domain
MADATDTKTVPLVITRTFAAPRVFVFKAWSTAEHVKRWFCPEGYTVPEAEVDFRPGGAFNVCMRSPEGQDFWSRGTYLEISPPERLVFTGSVGDVGAPKFTAHTTVTFEADGAGTRMTVRQAYEIHDEAFRAAIEGASEGWRTTLDKLELEVGLMRARESAAQMQPGGAVVHGSFTIERTYDAAPQAVFHALTDEAAKSRWFGRMEGCQVLERAMDVRPGGREHLSGRWASGMVSRFDAVYFDVVVNERLVYAYEMHLDERRISVSLATLTLQKVAAGTRLIVTEQGAFLDGYDDGGSREKGTGMLLDRLGQSLRRE